MVQTVVGCPLRMLISFVSLSPLQHSSRPFLTAKYPPIIFVSFLWCTD